MKKFCYILFIFISCTAVFAEKINKITFEQVSKYKFSDEALDYNIQEKIGDQFNEKTLNDDIKRLFATGSFQDIVAETRKDADGNVNVIFKIQAKPLLKEIIFEGNKKFTKDDLEKEVSLQTEQPLNDKNLRKSTSALRKFYRGKGYNEATIFPLVKNLEDDSVNVVFKINEHLRLKVNSVTFTGNSVFSSWTLKDSIATRYSFFSRFFEVGLYDMHETDLDKVRLRELYWNKGYLDFKVDNVTVTPEKGDPEYVDVNFKVSEGKPYIVDQIMITGNKKIKAERLLKEMPFKSGKVFDQSKVNDGRKMIEDEYDALGYADFQCQVVRNPDYETHKVSIEYKITEGIPYTVLDVNIKGNKVTKDKVIRRELAVQPGDPVDKTTIEASKARLMGMGYFKEVKAITVNSDEYGKKNVDFTVEEKNNLEFKIGGGYSDTDSLLGMVSLTNNNFDITDPKRWFQGGGQRLTASGTFGLSRYDAFIGFTEPWLFDIPLKLDVSGFFNNVAYDYWDERRIGTSIGLDKRIFDDFTSIAVSYKFGQVRVHNMDDELSHDTLRARGDDWVSTVQLELNRDTRDSLTEPTSGYSTGLLGSVSPKVLACSNNFYRTEAHMSKYFNFLDKAIILHVGGKMGILGKFNRDNDAPLYERYFLGGGNTLRGFPYREVSPVDDSDHNIGGMSMMLFTTEVTHPIWKFIRGAVFMDAGTVGKNSWSYSFNDLNIGVGYGLRLKLPMFPTPISLDLAYPVLNNQNNVSRKLRFHFNMNFSWQPGSWKGL